MRPAAACALFLLLAAGVARAQTTSAADLTTRGRSLNRILESVLFPESDPERSVLLVIDPSKALRIANFPSTLRQVLRVHAKETGRLRLGIAVLGAKKGEDPLPPGSDLPDIRKRAFDAIGSTRNVLRDVYTPLKRYIRLFARERGRRTIVLFSQQNGDTEYKIEKVIAALKSADIRVVVVTREVILSDSYWYGYSSGNVKPPARAYLAGSEAAFVEIPNGWIDQRRNLTDVAGSGFATWGLSRMAAGTGGSVEILYTSGAGPHRCGGESICPFCTGSLHVARSQTLRALRLKAVEPSLLPRRVVFKKAASDPYYKAVLRSWRAAYKADLTTQEPTVRRSGGSLVPIRDEERAQGYPWGELASNWRRSAQDAKSQAKAANRIATALRRSIAGGDRVGGSARYRAIAELTYIMLRLTRLNLLYLEAFYREVAPEITSRKARPPEFPEASQFFDPDGLAGFVVATNTLPLCHGVRPFFDLRMPGGNALDFELRLFAQDYRNYLKRNAHTPYVVALSYMGIARYRLMAIGKGNVKGNTGAARQSPNSRGRRNTDTAREKEPARGERGSGSSSGGTETPTSGG